MDTVLVNGTAADDQLSIDLRGGRGPYAVDGGAGYDLLSLPSDFLSAPRVPEPVLLDLSLGVISLRAPDGSGWQVMATLRNIEALYAGKGWDAQIIGDSGDNRLESFYFGSNNLLVGGGGNDTLIGGTADYSRTAGPVQASLAAHNAASVDGVDQLDVRNLIGSAFDDRLVGDQNPNILEGGGGNDTLVAAANNVGGGDTASFAHAPGGVTASLASGVSSGAAGADVLQGFAALIGSAYGDRLESGGAAPYETLFGGEGNDTLIGSANQTELHGGAGDDLIVGGSGVDRLSYEDAGAPVTARLGEGLVVGLASGSDHVSGIDQLIGSAFDDVLEGGPGRDALNGGGGRDTLIGEAGDDSLVNGTSIAGGEGNDQLTASAYAGVLRTLDGGAGNDTLSGGDLLLGAAGNDQLSIEGGWGLAWPGSTPGFLKTTPALTVDGGEGFDQLSMLPDLGAADLGRSNYVSINLATGVVRINAENPVTVVLRSIEALYDSKGWDSSFIGDEADNVLRAHSMSGAGGNDTLLPSGGPAATAEGGAGTDTLRLSGPRASHALLVGSDSSFSLRQGDALLASGSSVERFVFGDQALAFGERATEVVKLAFVLWSKLIAAYPELFGKGIDWYDHGHSFDELVRYALSFFADKSDAQLAVQMAANVPGRGDAELQSLIGSHGGGLEGRTYVVTLLCEDPANLANVGATGFAAAGLPCALNWGPEPLFLMPG